MHILWKQSMNKQVQVLEAQYKVEDDTKKDILLSIIADKYCRSIIGSTIDAPKSAAELAAETKIPISTIYRRLQTLHDNKLLYTSGMISNDGKKLFFVQKQDKGN